MHYLAAEWKCYDINRLSLLIVNGLGSRYVKDPRVKKYAILCATKNEMVEGNCSRSHDVESEATLRRYHGVRSKLLLRYYEEDAIDIRPMALSEKKSEGVRSDFDHVGHVVSHRSTGCAFYISR